MKYVLVTGGVISGIGKGVLASSVGALLKGCGLRVTSIKIDPYLNIDAGTFSPYEHGEVYVLADGGEVDLDLGNYERFLDVTLHRSNNITSGKVYRSVIEKERRGEYLGKTVQVVPHLTDEIQRCVEEVAQRPVDGSGLPPQVCIIELGGTIGDIEGVAFVEAFRQFQFRVKRENFCCMHVSLVPKPSSVGEHKTKPTQAGIRELREKGLTADFIVCRSEEEISQKIKDKISMICHIEPAHVICLPNADSIYHVPLMLEKQKVATLLYSRLHIETSAPIKPDLLKWRLLLDAKDNVRQEVTIAVVGKYVKLSDAYASVNKALQHSALYCKRKLNIMYIDSEDLEETTRADRDKAGSYHEAWSNVARADGILVPGGFGNRGFEGKVSVCRWARTKAVPFLGVCLGLQAAVVEYCRDVIGLKGATSQELDAEAEFKVIVEMPEHNQGDLGGTMRLGEKKTVFMTDDCVIRKLYGGVPFVMERHRHRYEVNTEYLEQMEDAGLSFVGQDEKNERMEIFELKDHPYYVACQYHPEYLSRPVKPSPPYLGLVLAAIGRLGDHLTSLKNGNKNPPGMVDSSSVTMYGLPSTSDHH